MFQSQLLCNRLLLSDMKPPPFYFACNSVHQEFEKGLAGRHAQSLQALKTLLPWVFQRAHSHHCADPEGLTGASAVGFPAEQPQGTQTSHLVSGFSGVSVHPREADRSCWPFMV